MVSLVVVLYNPSELVLNRWIELSKKCDQSRFYFIDNSSQSSKNIENLYGYKCLYGNYGIATAQNEGIRRAINESAKYIVFLDQDSEINKDYCVLLLREYIRIKSIVPNLAMLGPTVINKETMADYKMETSDNGKDFTITSKLISSGTIVDVRTLEDVGLMEDRLFIDAVDFEWCWRANNKGYVCARTERVKLIHKVGQKSISFCGIPFIISSSFRYYYQYRNWLWLIRRSYVPTEWKIKTSIRKIVELFMIPIFAKKKWRTICNMLTGIKDGILKY